MKVGVLDVQGDVTEHVAALRRAAESMGKKLEVAAVKTPKDIRSLCGIVIPGGESTTVSMLMSRYGLDKAVLDMACDIPIFGTCAGLVLLCREGANMMDGQKTLSLMDAKVIRNAFGRQRESFEAELRINELAGGPFPGVFIRAPAIERVWGKCKSMSTYDGKIVLARQDNILACAFHPELTDDTRIHEYFLEMI
jgi:5'-phosphate synthase pdxT subunit